MDHFERERLVNKINNLQYRVQRLEAENERLTSDKNSAEMWKQAYKYAIGEIAKGSKQFIKDVSAVAKTTTDSEAANAIEESLTLFEKQLSKCKP